MSQLTENKKLIIAVVLTSLVTGFGGYLIGNSISKTKKENNMISNNTCPHAKYLEMRMNRHEMLMKKHELMMRKHYQMMQEFGY